MTFLEVSLEHIKKKKKYYRDIYHNIKIISSYRSALVLNNTGYFQKQSFQAKCSERVGK